MVLVAAFATKTSPPSPTLTPPARPATGHELSRVTRARATGRRVQQRPGRIERVDQVVVLVGHVQDGLVVLRAAQGDARGSISRRPRSEEGCVELEPDDVEELHAPVPGVGDGDVEGAAEGGDIARPLELAVAAALRAPLGAEGAVRREPLDAVVARVRDEDNG